MVFIAKDNQPTLSADVRLHFAARVESDFREPPALQHGRIESRAIWTSTVLNDDLDFPHVGQVFAIERHTLEKKTGQTSTAIVDGATDHIPISASPARRLVFNRDLWHIEAHHDILDGNWDEDRGTVHRPWTGEISPACSASPSG